MKNLHTLCDLVSYQASNFKNPRVLNFKENGAIKSFSNQEFFENIFHFACGLREMGLQKGQTIGNYSYQNPIWLIVDLGAILAGAVTVPIFDNISNENLLYQISDSKIEFIFTDNKNFLAENSIEQKVIFYGSKNEKITSLEEVIALGKKAAAQKKYSFESLSAEVKEDDLATIIYTSGSTGKPKGVELTHKNLISQIKDTHEFFPLNQSDVVLSFLPLAHIFERMVMMFYLTQGVCIHFADDIKNVGNALREISPNLMTTVPRMLEKVFGKINDGIESGSLFKKFIGKKALKRALSKDPTSAKNFLDKIFDHLVYKKFRAALGGNMRMIICGGSALSNDLQCFYENSGVNIFCGYGLTECSPVISANCPTAHKIGTVGKIYQSLEIKIAADNELLVSGSNIMRGYHNQVEKTAEVFDGKWLKTGDLASLDSEGFLTITGRKKELFKNANGKYVSPVAIEQKLLQFLGFLLGSIVVAEGRRFTSAILFPEFENLEKMKSKLRFFGSDEEFLKSEKLQKFCAEKIAEVNKSLNHWEQIQKFYMAAEVISIQSGDITPSMKLKRNVLEEKYKKVIEGFYA